MIKSSLRTFTASAALLLAMSGLVLAQAPAPAQTPQRTTASYQDWTLRCEIREGTPPVKNCELVQSTSAQGQTNPLTQIAVGRASKTEPVKMVFQVPVNILIPANLTFVFDDKDKPVVVAFRQCIPAGCFADMELSNDMVKKLRTRTAQGHFDFKDAAQRAAAIPVSFKGFGEAYDALLKE